jgi:hypothetical protein
VVHAAGPHVVAVHAFVPGAGYDQHGAH